jgi:arylsulfatase
MAAELAGGARGANVVICVMDAARADHAGCYGYPRETTPNLDRLACESVVFRNHFTTSCSTRLATASLFTGLYPDTHLIRARGGLKPGTFTLASALKAAGWHTALFGSNVNASPEVGLGNGFVHAFPTWSGRQRSQNSQEVLSCGTPEVLTRAFATWVAGKRQTRFFAYLHLRPPHGPYDAPESLREAVTKQPAPAVVPGNFEFPEISPTDARSIARSPQERCDLYDANLRWADWGVGEVIRTLRAQGLLDKTLLIVTADHGEAFGEHGYMSHLSGVYDELVHIPLVMRLPGRPRLTGDVTALTQTVDLLPTILELVQAVFPRAQVQGRSLLPLLAGQPQAGRTYIFAADEKGWLSYLVRSQRWSLLLYRGGKLRALYDLQYDPAQRHNVLAAHPKAAAKMVAAFEAFARTQARPLAEFVSPNAPIVALPIPPRRALPEKARQNLKALGYLD